MNGFTGDVLAAGRSAAYASNLYRAIQQFVKWALVEEEMTRDPLVGTAGPQVPEQPVPVLTVDQLRAAPISRTSGCPPLGAPGTA